MIRPIRFLLPALLAVAGVISCAAQEWTRFRGPNGTGISPAKNVPVAWTEQDFAWRVPIRGESHSQPVIWGDKIFFLTAIDTGRERALLCLSKRDGRELWAKSYPLPMPRLANRNTGYANGSPVVDAERVIACFASEEHFWVRAFDHDGKELWSRDFGTYVSQHGHGASPMIFENTVIVPNDQEGDCSVMALSLQTGATVWITRDEGRPSSSSRPGSSSSCSGTTTRS